MLYRGPFGYPWVQQQWQPHVLQSNPLTHTQQPQVNSQTFKHPPLGLVACCMCHADWDVTDWFPLREFESHAGQLLYTTWADPPPFPWYLHPSDSAASWSSLDARHIPALITNNYWPTITDAGISSCMCEDLLAAHAWSAPESCHCNHQPVLAFTGEQSLACIELDELYAVGLVLNASGSAYSYLQWLHSSLTASQGGLKGRSILISVLSVILLLSVLIGMSYFSFCLKESHCGNTLINFLAY